MVLHYCLSISFVLVSFAAGALLGAPSQELSGHDHNTICAALAPEVLSHFRPAEHGKSLREYSALKGIQVEPENLGHKPNVSLDSLELRPGLERLTTIGACGPTVEERESRSRQE
jgi:hypothetical protein